MRKVITLSILGMLCLAPLMVFAQVGADAPVIVAGPSVDDPLPLVDFDLIDSVMVLISTFQSAWFLGVALCLFLLVNLVRGKMRIGSWYVKIPVFSDWLEGTGKKFKTYFIVGLTGLGMAFAALQTVEAWEAWPVAKAMLSGLLGGVQLALAALGLNSVVKNTKKEKEQENEKTITKGCADSN